MSTRWLWGIPLLLAAAGCRGTGGLRDPDTRVPDPALVRSRPGTTALPRPPAGKPAPPARLGPARRIAAGVTVRQGAVAPRGLRAAVWIYAPERPPAGPLPCVLIAPAGTRLFHGIGLGEGDRAEHLPYARAGFVVVAYELDGPLREEPSDREAITAATAYKEADAGLADAKAALDYALANVPAIDKSRIYCAGHSSAATHALLLAENEPRIRACVAFAPVCDLPPRLGSQLVQVLEPYLPGYAAFVQRSSPMANIDRLRCPVFLFHADDDTNVPTEEVSLFAQALKERKRSVTFVRVPSGGHYDSMVQQGIPRAIAWLRFLGRTGGA